MCNKFVDDYHKTYFIYICLKLHAPAKLLWFEDTCVRIIVIQINITSRTDIHIMRIYSSVGTLQFSSREQNLNVMASLG